MIEVNLSKMKKIFNHQINFCKKYNIEHFDIIEFSYVLRRKIIQNKWDTRKLERSLKKKEESIKRKINKV